MRRELPLPDQRVVRDHHPHLPALHGAGGYGAKQERDGLCDRRHEGRQAEVREFLKFIGALLGGVVGVLLAAVWAAALVLAGPALLKLCISYLFF